MPELPSGTVTFLFTDIEGSTPLWEQHPEAIKAALARHDAILHAAIKDNGGQVYKLVGDAFDAAFTLPAQAVKAALTAQRALAAETWDPETGPIKVRMGIHSGPAEVHGVEYSGHTLNRVARIMAAGHGGQILLSLVTAELAHHGLPKDVQLKDLGEHPLKGLSQPEHLFQVLVPGLPQDFPPLVTKHVPRGYQLRELIGEGGFGEVYRAFHPDVGREVAVKIIRAELADQSEFIRRFEAEAQIVARLEHPRIVPLYDYWREPGGAFLVMRLLRGGSLHDLLTKGPLSLEQAGELLAQMAEALAAAHAQDIVHRDIKPANILLDEAGNYYLSDFGIAKVVSLEGGQTGTIAMVGSPLYMSPEQMLGEAVTPQSDIYSLGEVLYEALVGECPFRDESLARLIDRQLHEPVPQVSQRRPELPAGIDEVIQQATAKQPEERFPDVLAFAAAFRAALSGAPLPPKAIKTTRPTEELANPYKGLRAFQEADAEDFFGREALVERLLARLSPSGDAFSTNGHGPESGRFLAVVGPSGSGKSSLVRAGLLPALRRGALPGSEQWFVVEMIPGPHPLEELEAALLRVAVNPPESLLNQLKEDRRGLLRAVKRILPADEGVELLLILDQFEEVFTLVEDPAETRHFLDSLYSAVSEPRSRLRAVITLRADFYDRPLMYPDFSELVRHHTEAIVPLTADELSRAIAGPAQRFGLELEEGLTPVIVAEVNEQPGALPLLQYALTELFDRREGRLLTRAAYQEIGGVSGALGRRAEELFQGLDPAEQETARQVFLRLVTLGEGVEDTRRRALQAELEALTGHFQSFEEGPLQGIGDKGKGPIEEVLDTYGQARLLSFDRDPLTRGPTVEVAHEALLRVWRRLREWLDESREGLRLQRRLGVLAGEWLQAGRETGFLLRGSRLDQFEAWAAATDLALTADERAYLQESLFEREARRAAEAERQAREAALEARSRRVLRALVAVFAVAAVVAVLLSLFAFGQQRLARQNEALAGQNAATAVAARGEAEQLAALRSREAEVNQSLALAAQSQLALQADNQDLALALAWEAVDIPDPPGQAQLALSEAAYAPGTIRVFLGHEAPVWSVAVSPDGVYGLSGDEAGVIYLWDLETGEALRHLEGHTGRVSSLAFTPDGRQALSASADKTILHWDLEKGEVIRQINDHQAGVNALAISPDGSMFASGSGRLLANDPFSSADNSLRLWDLETGQEIRRVGFFTDGVTGIDFTPDGQKLAVGTVSDGFQLLEVESGKALIHWNQGILNLRSQDDAVDASSDGLHVLTTNRDAILIWDLESGEPSRLDSHNCFPVSGLDISPDGKRALTGSCETVEYDLMTGEEILRFPIRTNVLAYLPDGRRALAGSEDGSLRLLALASGAEIGRLPPSENVVRGVAYDPNGQSVVVNETFQLSHWDLQTGDEIWRTGGGWDVAFSPDGSRILSSGLVKYVFLLDAATGKNLRRLESDGSFEGHADANNVDAVAFHPSGDFALSGAQGGTTLIYWDLETGKPVWLFDTENSVLGVAISPDGRTALSGEADGAVNWWDLETGQLLKRLEGHTNAAWGVAFVDYRTAISTSDDRTMILWDLESGTPLRTFLGHTSGIWRLALSPDKRLALSASNDGTAILWDIQTGEPLRRYAGHSDEVLAAGISPDGKEALTDGRDGQAIRWRIDADLESFLEWVEGNRYVRSLTCDERAAFQVEPLCESTAISEEGEPGATATPVPVSGSALLSSLPLPTPMPIELPLVSSPLELAGTAVWGVNHGSIAIGSGQVWEYLGQAGERLSLRVAADNPANLVKSPQLQIENGLLDPTLAVYAPNGSLLAQADDLENGLATNAYLESLTLPEAGIHRIEVRSYLNQTGGGYRLVLAEPRPLVLKANVPTTAGLALHPDGRTALVGAGYGTFLDSPVAEDNRIWVWDLKSGVVLRYLEGHVNTPASIAISPDGRQAISVDPDGVGILWDLQTGMELIRLDNQGEGFLFVLFHPDGQSVLTSSSDRKLALWDLTSGEVIRRFEGHEDWVLDLALSPDGQTAYSTAWDNTLRAWNTGTGELLATYQPFADSVTAGLAISPDGQMILVGSLWDDPTISHESLILLLDANTGKKLRELEGHTSTVGALAFSPDGRYALSGSLDRTVRLWDVNTAEQLAVFTGHDGDVFTVAFSPDGLTGYSTGTDGALRVWDLREYIGDS